MGATKTRTVREGERLGRQRAFAGARLALADNISMDAAAERVGSKRSSVQEAMMILRLGTPEEITAVELNNAPMGKLTDAIYARTTPEERRATARKPVYHQDVTEGRGFDAEVWAKVREALDALTSLPMATDVVAIVRKNPQRNEMVSRKLLPAHTWLEDFINAYTE